MPKPIFSTRSRIPAAKADKLLRCYAERLEPTETAKRTGLSLNTVYDQYSRIRWRLIEVGYYRDAALSKDEYGLSEEAKAMLRQRRGLEDGDIYAHAAEVIEWLEEWPAGTVLRQLRKIIELTGPLDKPLSLSEPQAVFVAAYVRYTRTKLIHERVVKVAESEKTPQPLAEKTADALRKHWRAYRRVEKQLWRYRRDQND
ncbi:hypothetical protein [uncultured Ruegeria sp.]|uniref:hypothetical protein n=1 Tax=uncultured Ruegeria sp. TaxID=259304 RepID=UPI002601BFB0|nr:hypothetical protein [uncultured Ruegeria sp.]